MNEQAREITLYQADSRRMVELDDASIDLIVTSPPYWQIKDYGVEGQIGYGQTLHDYLRDLYRVWEESFRVLQPGRRLCVNIGDQFTRASIYGRYKVIPLHAEIIVQAEQIGFDYLGAIIWQKRTTMETTGGATIMGSFPYPPNGIVEIDYEYILIFKKPGKSKRQPASLKESSRMTKEEWKTYFSGHWRFGGARQTDHEATFPLELPRRLIRMFSFTGETVLDPFAGSGTTLIAALQLDRHAIGYEIAPHFTKLIQQRVEQTFPPMFGPHIAFHRRENPLPPLPPVAYHPAIQDISPPPPKNKPPSPTLHRVTGIEGSWLVLDTGMKVGLRGIEITQSSLFERYARRYLLGKQVFLKEREPTTAQARRTRAYVYLKNRIFVNRYLLKAGLARATQEEHRLKAKFLRWEKEGRQDGQRMDP